MADKPQKRNPLARLVLLSVGLALGAAIGYLGFWPIDVEPVAWNPPEGPALSGPLAVNSLLADAKWLKTPGPGPEAVAFDKEGRLYTGLADGRILRMGKDGSGVEVFTNTAGRPLGLRFDAQGALIVADADRGLLKVDDKGGVRVLTSSHSEGKVKTPFRITDDLVIAPDGVIYFTDASSRFPLSIYVQDLLEHRGSGRLLSYDPKTATTRLLRGGLHFPNGITLSHDGQALLVTETGMYRVLYFPLRKPPEQGVAEPEVFVDNLPGFPDNITTSPTEKIYYVALASTRNKVIDQLGPYPFLRKMVARLPPSLRPKPARHGLVVCLSMQGRILGTLQDTSPESYSPIASATEYEGLLYLGSFQRPAVAVVAPRCPKS